MVLFQFLIQEKSATIVLVIDEKHLQHVHFLACISGFRSLSKNWGNIVWLSRTESVYDFSVASADVLPGEKSPTQESLKAFDLRQCHLFVTVEHAIFSPLRPYKLNIP